MIGITAMFGIGLIELLILGAFALVVVCGGIILCVVLLQGQRKGKPPE